MSSSVSAVECNQMIASSFGQYRAMHSDLTFPWENGVMADIFGASNQLSLPQCVGIGEQVIQTSLMGAIDSASGGHVDPLPHDAKYLSAVQS